MLGLYDLSTHPTTFDFASWVVIARTHGVNHVRFSGEMSEVKYSKEIAWKRFGNILVPLCTIGGLDFSVGERVGREFGYTIKTLELTFEHFGHLEKLKPTGISNLKNYVTITLRDSFRNKYRNSNKDAWGRFEKYLEQKNKNVLVFPECEKTPFDLEDRMSLYCGAAQNLGSAGGPMTLCHFSEAPYITLNMNPVPDAEAQYDGNALMKSWGFFERQYTFRTKNQLLVWEPDSFENIVKAYEENRADSHTADSTHVELRASDLRTGSVRC